ncbi:outer membrane beta-barrel protein [Dokdonia sp. Asnod3-C12]|uniref:outer membrane beta-barrel protein n=1 Tax=Dokdonia sp. Asnod3-C12 TaxID=3160575 RepID=UPI003869435D
MKKIVLSIIFFAFLCSTQLFAQGVRFGFKAGLSVSEISNLEYTIVNTGLDGDPAIAPFNSIDEGRYGFAVAFLAEIPVTNKLSFQPEFAFASQGNKYEGVRYDFLQIPLGLRLNLNRLFLIAGPQVGLKISFYEQSENYKSFDFSAFGGLGYHFNESIFVEARFTKGFLEVFEDDAAVRLPYTPGEGDPQADNNSLVNGDNFLVNGSGTNQYITLSIGYRL